MHIYFENKFILDFGKSKLYVYVQNPSCGLHLGATSLMSKSGYSILNKIDGNCFCRRDYLDIIWKEEGLLIEGVKTKCARVSPSNSKVGFPASSFTRTCPHLNT